MVYNIVPTDEINLSVFQECHQPLFGGLVEDGTIIAHRSYIMNLVVAQPHLCINKSKP